MWADSFGCGDSACSSPYYRSCSGRGELGRYGNRGDIFADGEAFSRAGSHTDTPAVTHSPAYAGTHSHHYAGGTGVPYLLEVDKGTQIVTVCDRCQWEYTVPVKYMLCTGRGTAPEGRNLQAEG